MIERALSLSQLFFAGFLIGVLPAALVGSSNQAQVFGGLVVGLGAVIAFRKNWLTKN